MRTFATTTCLAAMTAAVLAAAVEPASAACTRLGFSVNDYGKDGPTQDAKKLLDGYVARWAAERGIKSYRTGKKDVNCELFLNLIVFDEHTCRAEATVCWDGPPVAPQSTPGQAATAPATKPAGALKRAALPAAGVRPSSAAKAAPAAAAAPADIPAAAPVAAPAAAPVAKPAAVETGTVPAAKPAAEAPAKPAAAGKADTATDQALQAAQRAAAAAERAAAAAERAAAAAAAAEKGSAKP